MRKRERGRGGFAFVPFERSGKAFRYRRLVRQRSRRTLSAADGRVIGLRGEIGRRMGGGVQTRKRGELQRTLCRFGRNVLRQLPMNGKFARIRGTARGERRRLVVSDRLFDDHVPQRSRILLLLQLLAPNRPHA